MSGPRLLSESIPRVTSKVFERKYIMLGRLVTRWADIVGPDLAEKTQPIRIRRISKGKDKQAGTSLDIAATTADATVLHYQKDLIQERINQIFGEGLVTAIRFVPIAANKPSVIRKRNPRPLTDTEKKFVAEHLEHIDDEEMRTRLLNLGWSMTRQDS